ncbi:polar growth protein, partial [Ascosphaera aggregata]
SNASKGFVSSTTTAATTGSTAFATATADHDVRSDSEASYVDSSLRELYRPLSTFALDIDFSNNIKDNQQESVSPPLNPADVLAELSTLQRENSKSSKHASSVRSFNAFRPAGLTANTTTTATTVTTTLASKDSCNSMHPDDDRDSPVLNETLSFINAHITKLNAKNNSTASAATLASLTDTTAASGLDTTTTTVGDTVGATRALSPIRQHEKEGSTPGSTYPGDYNDGDYTTMMPEPETESESDDDQYQEKHPAFLPPTIAMQSQQQQQQQLTQKQSYDQAQALGKVANDSASEYSANLSLTNYNGQTRPSSQQYSYQTQPHSQQYQQQQQHHPNQHYPSTPSTSASNESTTSTPYLTADQVKQWSPAEVSHHLLTIGVDPQHCIVFEEQEITGDVLLEMDQSTMFMKEFNFGTMGRRLKTWYRIKAFQEEVLCGADSHANSGIVAAAAAASAATSMHGSRTASRTASRSASRMGAGITSTANYNLNNNSAIMGPSGGLGTAIAHTRNTVASSIRQSLIPSDAQRDDSTTLPRMSSDSGGKRPSSPYRSYSQTGGATSGSKGIQGQGHGHAPIQNPAAYRYGHGHLYSASTGSASVHNQPYLHHQQQVQNPASAHNAPRYQGIGEVADQLNNQNFGHPAATFSGAAHPFSSVSAASASFSGPSRPGTNMTTYSANPRLLTSSDSADAAAPPPIVGGTSSRGNSMVGFNELQHSLAKQVSQGQIPKHAQDSMSLTNGPSSLSQVDVDRGYFSEMETQTPGKGSGNAFGTGLGTGTGKIRGRSGNGFKK